MDLLVLDTNVIVSALLSRNGACAQLVSAGMAGNFVPCFDDRIMREYIRVLSRPRFSQLFSEEDKTEMLKWVYDEGLPIMALPIDVEMPDESDRKFLEVALSANAILVTGNLKHYPQLPTIMSVRDYLLKEDMI